MPLPKHRIIEPIVSPLRTFVQRKPQAAIVLLLMGICTVVYLSNGDLYNGSNDNVPSTLLAFNWLENQTLTFDNFRDTHYFQARAPYFFTESSNGHVVSTYPIGSALVTFPLYLLFFVFLKLAALFSGTDILATLTQPEFQDYRQTFSKLAAALCSALSVGLFYLAVRLKFQQTTALIASFVFAFATTTWALSSQDLRQHTISNLLVIAATLCFWKANHILPARSSLSSHKFQPDSAENSQNSSQDSSAIDFQPDSSTHPLSRSGDRSPELEATELGNGKLETAKLETAKLETASRRQAVLLLMAGFFCGLLPGVRLTSAIFTAAFLVFAVYAYRKRSIFFLLGLPSLLFNLGWNIYFFGWRGFLGGGYGQMFDAGASSYVFTPAYVLEAFAGQLISPSDGLITFSPVLLFAIPGFWRVWQRVFPRRGTGNLSRFDQQSADEQLLLLLTFACVGLFLHYCVYQPWTGGADSYGPRFLTDVVPIVCLLVTYSLDSLIQKLTARSISPENPVPRRTAPRLTFAIFLALLILSTGIQAVGAFTKTDWGAVPVPLISQPSRLWQLHDSQIERNTRNLIAKAVHPIRDRQAYCQGLDGAIEEVEWLRVDGNPQPIGQSLTVRQNFRRFFKLRLKNTGQSPWYGYETGMMNIGETRVRLLFFDQNGRRVSLPEPNFFAISGTVKPGETVEAIGRIVLPRKAGTYEARLWLVATGLEGAKTARPPIHSFTIKVEPRNQE
ncbi:hypothetical protein [Leptolyngbya ohadii]|uniref:hypothetical protein n=1 Tax=Leptolyngbya ohadii TaxID=1962290 RepID=UPI000B59E0CB|nr:hypothetical protein [Leptolyngbya ohadii]